MFVARFSDIIDVEISCDGCGVTLPGRRYRCLQVRDIDREGERERDTHTHTHIDGATLPLPAGMQDFFY